MRHACRALIVGPEEESVLLAKRSYHDPAAPGEWALLGGKVDEGETPAQAIEREVLEEAGVEFIIEGHYTQHSNQSWATDFYFGHIQGELQLDPNEHSEAKFFGADELSSLEIAFDHKDIIVGFLESLAAHRVG